MYNLTIHFGPNAVAWSFLFKGKEKAEAWVHAANNETAPPRITIEDDYGQIATIVTASIHGVLLEDTEAGQEARILRGIEKARGQARATKRAMSDPEIQQMQRGQGPSVITPFSNGGFRPQ